MNKLIYIICFFSIFIPFFLNNGESSVGDEPGPLLWNLSNLEYLKHNSTQQKKTYKRIIKEANNYCMTPPVVVTDKKHTFSPNNHYYCSLGGYWWPDSLNTGKYVHKEVKSPLSNEYDAFRLSELRNRCSFLSVAFYLTDDSRYLECFIDQIKAWFINEDTYMYPNFEYVAVVPGKNRNKGRVSGMIQAYSFIDVIESILLVNSIRPIDDEILANLKKWFSDFVNWSEDGRFGPSLQKATNNIGVAYDIMLIEMYLFIGEERKARAIVDDFSEKRLNVQIDEEGKQKAELNRSNAYSYSLYNLSHILDFCFISNYWNLDYYTKHQDVIDRAYLYLQQYENNQEAFPYQQITEWSKCQQQLHSQLLRRERLRGNICHIFKESDSLISLNALLN